MKRQLFTLLTLAAMPYCAASEPVAIPDFINTSANKIEDDLPLFRHGLERLGEGADTVVHIVHIGDSHIQAEFVTCRLRALLQERYGDAGRGLTVPLRLAGTNQSHDFSYNLTSGADAPSPVQTRLLKFPWPLHPGFTGIAVQYPEAQTVTLSVPGHKFDRMKVYTSSGERELTFSPTDSASFGIDAGETLYGTLTTNGHSGVIYSAIGNNGACFTDYSLIDGFPKSVASLHPDLLILSMGTNEGFSTMTDEEIRRSVRNLIRSLQANSPGSEILVLAPMECQKNRNHGHKPLSPYFDINTRVAEARAIIVDEARNCGVAVWDFYPIAGGEGASTHWLDAGFMNKDRIHLLRPGYELEAQLLYDALTQPE